MRVNYIGTIHGKPVVEINGLRTSLWVSEMSRMTEENTGFGVSIEGFFDNEHFLEVTNKDTGRMWRWRVDEDTGETTFRGSKIAMRRL